MSIQVGMKVMFGRRQGEQTLGTVVKVNRTTVQVRQEEARGTMRNYPVGTMWKVPMNLCRGMDEATRAPKAPVMAPEVQARLKSNQDRDFDFLMSKRTRRDEATIMREILTCYCELSPENLWCDGEATRTQAMRKARLIKGRLSDLFRELGRKVTEDEAFKHGRF